MNKLKVGSCFSGVGFWEMGLKELQIPHTNEFCVEFDKYPYASYKAIHGDVKNYGDVTQIQGHEVEDIDLFFYSPPCQAFSVAGKGLGVEEHRGVLFFDSLRIIQHKQPRIAIMENVKGLTNKPHEETLRSMLACLTMAGYINYLKVLNTKDYGIPQNRERVFIVSIRNDIYTGFDWPEPFDNGLRLKHLLESEVDEKYYIGSEKCAKLISQLNSVSKVQFGIDLTINEPKEREYANCIKARYDCGISNQKQDGTDVCVPCLTPDRVEKRQNGRRFKEDGDPSFTLTSQDKHGILISEEVENRGVIVKEATKKGFAVAYPGDSINMEQPNSLTRRGRVGKEVAQTLTCSCNQAVVEPNELNCLGMLDIKGNEQIRRVYDDDGISPTLSTMQGGNREPKVYTQYRIRKLTPKECWRLQGATDEDFEKAASVNSNSQLYKQAGNGLSVNVVTQILKQLQAKSYI